MTEPRMTGRRAAKAREIFDALLTPDSCERLAADALGGEGGLPVELRLALAAGASAADVRAVAAATFHSGQRPEALSPEARTQLSLLRRGGRLGSHSPDVTSGEAIQLSRLLRPGAAAGRVHEAIMAAADEADETTTTTTRPAAVRLGATESGERMNTTPNDRTKLSTLDGGTPDEIRRVAIDATDLADPDHPSNLAEAARLGLDPDVFVRERAREERRARFAEAVAERTVAENMATVTGGDPDAWGNLSTSDPAVCATASNLSVPVAVVSAIVRQRSASSAAIRGHAEASGLTPQEIVADPREIERAHARALGAAAATARQDADDVATVQREAESLRREIESLNEAVRWGRATGPDQSRLRFVQARLRVVEKALNGLPQAE